MKFRSPAFRPTNPSPLNIGLLVNLSVICLLSLVVLCCRPQAASGQEAAPAAGMPGVFPSGANAGGSPLSALKLYIVIDGRLETRTLRRRELADAAFATEGYISGIVAVGKKGLEARVNGRPMSPVEPKADGSFSFGYYGHLKPEQLLDGQGEENEQLQAPAPPRKPLLGADVYSCFPKVPADTISKKGRFFIEVETGDSRWCMRVDHNGGRYLGSTSGIGAAGSPVPFRCVGNVQEAVNKSGDDLLRRVEAVARGIQSVESTFHMHLVGTVNILDFDDIHNAVTCLNRNDIWFYINTFTREPVNELNVIAEHEALHILVDRLGLTGDTTVRKMFADLKGFEPLSIDRFRMVTQGRAGARTRLQKGEQGYFFDFISERNFLNGMKGGHPQEDLDEFCTSFLHTLMYMDRFEANLQQIDVGMQARQAIVSNYIRLLGVVNQRILRSGAFGGNGAGAVLPTAFVSDRLALLKGLDQQFQASNAVLSAAD